MGKTVLAVDNGGLVHPVGFQSFRPIACTVEEARENCSPIEQRPAAGHRLMSWARDLHEAF